MDTGQSPVSGRERTRAYACLFALVAWMAAQEVWAMRAGEPYPAMRLPFFSGGGVAAADDIVVVLPRFIARTHRDDAIDVPTRAIFGRMPAHIAAVVVRFLFGPKRWDASFVQPAARGYLPGRAIGSVRSRDQGLAWRAAPWLRQRLHGRARQEGWRSLTVQWVERSQGAGAVRERIVFSQQLSLTP